MESKSREKIMQCLDKAAESFKSWLESEDGSEGAAYIQKRGISQEMLDEFKIGMSPEHGYKMYKTLTKGMSAEEIDATGLFIRKVNGRIVNRFYGRLMFPIMDVDGRTVGFGARRLHSDGPKYINSPQSSIFLKKELLYGLHAAKNHCENGLIFCEGYMDVITMHQYGFRNAVASLGTSLTEEQVKLAGQYTRKILLLYDSDQAGITAAKRAIGLCRKEGLEVRVVQLDGAKDPDEYLHKFEKEQFRKCLDNAERADLFEVRQAKEKYDEDSDVKAFSQEMVRIYGYNPAKILKVVNTL